MLKEEKVLPVTEEQKEISAGGEEKKKKKVPWSWIYIGATIVAIVVFGVYNNQFQNVFKTLSTLNLAYIALALALLFLYFLFESEIMRIMMKSQNIILSHAKSFKLAIIGLYYSAITPSATGGQPAQSAYLCRDKIPAGSSTAVLIMKFFTFQVAFELCSLVSFFFMYDNLKEVVPAMIPLIILGLIINGASVIFFPCLFFKPILNFFVRVAKWFVNKIGFLRKRTHLMKTIDKFENDFGSFTDDFKEKQKTIILCVLLSIPQFFAQMSVIYYIFLSFGYRGVNYFEIFAVQSILQVSVSFMPMPGASGAQELGFSTLFRQYFTNDDLFAGVMVWRFFTYYLVVIGGAAMVVIDQMLYSRKEKRLEIPQEEPPIK